MNTTTITLEKRVIAVGVQKMQTVMQCTFMDDYTRFGGTCCFHLQNRNKLRNNIGYVIPGVGQDKCLEKGCILNGGGMKK